MKVPEHINLGVKNYAVIVSGKQQANFYIVKNRELKELVEFKIENPKYSDREGFFVRAGFGRNFGSGSVYESKKNELISKYTHELREKVVKLIKSAEPQHVYLLGPQYLSPHLKEMIPLKYEHQLITFTAGNFTKLTPIEVLEIINKERSEILGQKVPVNETARKILGIKK